MQKFAVKGMSCAACSARVEKAVLKVKGVKSCAVSLLTNSMTVDGDFSEKDVIDAVKNAGYSAFSQDGEKSEEKDLKDTETPKLIKRLAASVVLLLVLMYFSMGHMMLGLPLPKFFNNNHVAMGLVQLLLSAMVMVINQKFFISGFKGLIHRSPNMDTLVALGSFASFAWSVYALFLMTDAVLKGNDASVMMYMNEFYFESAAMILTLISIGKMLEAHSKGKTTDAIKSLMSLAPKTATLIIDQKEVTVKIDQVKKGDIFVVRPGESIPVDGTVVEGVSAVDESALTGESIPADKAPDDSVSGGTINKSGFLKCRAERVGQDTTLSQIIRTVSDAAATKAPIAKAADKVSGVFVPAVITIAIITLAVWLILGADFSYALARSISVLVISCPCALGLATPVAIMVGSGVGARNGILFKNAATLENLGKVKVAALDKTGTISQGMPEVTDIISENCSEEELLKYAASLESKSEHPLAKAVMKKCDDAQIKTFDADDFLALPGNGLTAKICGKTVYGGSLKFISEKVAISEFAVKKANELSDKGKTPLLFCADNELLGIIAVADTIKSDSPDAIKELKSMGIKVIMLTGDNERTAKAIGELSGVDEVIAGVLPNEKERVINSLKQQGKVVMVGDGINDAPALTAADVGVAIGAGADIAIDAADTVLMKSRLSDVPAAIRLSRATLRNIHENLFWAFIYNTIGIPLAAGCFVSLNLTLNPMFGAAAMSLSSFCVVMNALRLNLVKLHSKNREAADNVYTIKIKGMMCEHCEKRIKEALEKLPEIESVKANHNKNIAQAVINGKPDEKRIREAIEEQGYKFVSIK